MRSLVILPAFLTTFAGAVLVTVWVLSHAVAPDSDTAYRSGATPQDPAAVAFDEAQY
ncbi:MAG: hypothetical protein VX871_10715 [Pseudomonadota bacterium]|nr:hypothetical protein [Pseudomonadota bacterium]